MPIDRCGFARAEGVLSSMTRYRVSSASVAELRKARSKKAPFRAGEIGGARAGALAHGGALASLTRGALDIELRFVEGDVEAGARHEALGDAARRLGAVGGRRALEDRHRGEAVGGAFEPVEREIGRGRAEGSRDGVVEGAREAADRVVRRAPRH